MQKFTRAATTRRILAGLAAAATMSLLAGCAGPAPEETPSIAPVVPADLRVTWWGSDERAAATEAALKIITTDSPDITFTTEASGFDGYFDRYTTQVAGGNAPDLVQMNFVPQLADYANRGALLDLTPYVEAGVLDLSGYDESSINLGKVDGGLYGLPFSTVTPAVVFNQTVLDQYGIDAPEIGWDWDDFEDITTGISEESGGTVYGSNDASSLHYVYEVWYLGKTGEQLYTADGERTDSAEDVAEWWQMWADLRDAGAIVPADLSAAHVEGDNATDPVVLGKSAMLFNFSAAQGTLRSLVPGTLGIVTNPVSGDYPQQYVRPGSLFSISADSKAPGTAVEVLNQLSNNEEVIATLGTTRGTPASSKARGILQSDLSADDAALFAFIDEVSSGDVAQSPSVLPEGSLDVEQLFTRLAQDVSFGTISPKDAAASFFEQIPGLLG